MSGQGVVERASAELSKRINGLTLRVNKYHSQKNNNSNGNTNSSSSSPFTRTTSVMEKVTTVLCGNSNLMKENNDDSSSIGGGGGGNKFKVKNKIIKKPRRCLLVPKSKIWEEMILDENFLNMFFSYFSPSERTILCQVCTKWRDVLYKSPKFWPGIVMTINCKEFKKYTIVEKTKLFSSFVRRGFRVLSVVSAKDPYIKDIINSLAVGTKYVQTLILKWSTVTDKGLEIFVDNLQSLQELEIIGCNELTESGLWACLTPRLITLKISDCINIADESLVAVGQLLPALNEFSLQAYHVTDAALGFFSAKQSASLTALKLQSCWEITNHGIVNIVHSLPNLTVLSLSGCSKVTDDGVEFISENLRQLRILDLSWCPRITDLSLEYIACDLTLLQQLTLDRSSNITDVGIGYLSTMPSLNTLYLRWCSKIRDPGVQHLSNMKSLMILSIAGCPLLTASSLSSLSQMKHLKELELTNCPAATSGMMKFLRQQLPTTVIIT